MQAPSPIGQPLCQAILAGLLGCCVNSSSSSPLLAVGVRVGSSGREILAKSLFRRRIGEIIPLLCFTTLRGWRLSSLVRPAPYGLHRQYAVVLIC